MSFILPDEISDAEMLYRSVPDKPNMWKPEFNRPSSALFKDSKGVSVDRDGGRSIEEIIANFDRKMPERGLVSITAGECRKIGTKPVAKPLEDNIYHAEIHDGDGNITVKGNRPKKLSNSVRIIKLPPHFSQSQKS